MLKFSTRAMMASLMLSTAPAAFADKIFVSNERDNTVTVIDSDTLKVIKSIPTGRRPRGLALTPDNKELVVCIGDDNRLDVIDTDKLEVTKSFAAPGPDPEPLAINHKGYRIYVANEDDSLVTVMDRTTGQAITEIPVGVEPEGMAVSPDDSLVVNTSEQTSMAHFIDAKTNTVLANVLVDTRPREATFTKYAKEVWVSAEVGGTVAIIDTKTFETKKKLSFDVPGVRPELMQPIGIRFTLDGKTAFVALGPSNRVAVVDAATHEIKSYILVGQRPWHLALKPDGTKLYVANGMTNDMTVIDVATLKAEKSVPVGRLPWGVAVKPDPK